MITTQAIKRLRMQDANTPAGDDLCDHSRDANIDIVRSNVDQRWSLIIDNIRQLDGRYDYRGQAIDALL